MKSLLIVLLLVQSYSLTIAYSQSTSTVKRSSGGDTKQITNVLNRVIDRVHHNWTIRHILPTNQDIEKIEWLVDAGAVVSPENKLLVYIISTRKVPLKGNTLRLVNILTQGGAKLRHEDLVSILNNMALSFYSLKKLDERNSWDKYPGKKSSVDRFKEASLLKLKFINSIGGNLFKKNEAGSSPFEELLTPISLFWKIREGVDSHRESVSDYDSVVDLIIKSVEDNPAQIETLTYQYLGRPQRTSLSMAKKFLERMGKSPEEIREHLNKERNQGQSYFENAAKNSKSSKLIELLYKYGDLEKFDNSGQTIVHSVILNTLEKGKEYTLTLGAGLGRTTVRKFYTVIPGNWKIFELFRKKRADFSSINKFGETPIMLALKNLEFKLNYKSVNVGDKKLKIETYKSLDGGPLDVIDALSKIDSTFDLSTPEKINAVNNTIKLLEEKIQQGNTLIEEYGNQSEEKYALQLGVQTLEEILIKFRERLEEHKVLNTLKENPKDESASIKSLNGTETFSGGREVRGILTHNTTEEAVAR